MNQRSIAAGKGQGGTGRFPVISAPAPAVTCARAGAAAIHERRDAAMERSRELAAGKE
jgi:hypothetical protein